MLSSEKKTLFFTFYFLDVEDEEEWEYEEDEDEVDVRFILVNLFLWAALYVRPPLVF